MTTDITELAQLRAELLSPAIGSSAHLRKIALSLVEALEKAQQRIDELENDEVRQRLANAEHQLYMAELAKNNLRASRKAQFRKRKAAEQRIAELESRTVTVKLPQRLQPGADGWDDWYVHSDDEGEYLKFDDVLAMLTAAGIKVEAELWH
ncbi:hypothetical protein [Klebsiella pneumoniae]|uniref:hypothetical protein n=1 Tax=Klebsiella pneumoniae TaxID=573 RepID=UPI00277C2899|nr:hypothetical protein [Klebsiella pneumoniae]